MKEETIYLRIFFHYIYIDEIRDDKIDYNY